MNRPLIALLVFLGAGAGIAVVGQSPGGAAPSDGSHPSKGTTLMELRTRTHAAVRDAVKATQDPRIDAWDSEVLAEKIDAQLKKLCHHLKESATGAPTLPENLIAADFTYTMPDSLNPVFKDDTLEIQRAVITAEVRITGVSGVSAALTEALRGTTDTRFKAKTFRIDQEPPHHVTTLHYYASFGARPDGSVEQHATWQCRWELSATHPPLLHRLDVLDIEQAQLRAPEGTWFTDCTKSVLGHEVSFREQMMHGLPHWLKRIERIHLIDSYGVHGIATGDVNGDGLDDLYVCQPGGLPNRLFVQNPDGTADDRSAAAGVDWLDQTVSALLADLDNDGDQDLVAATYAQLLVMANDGHGNFTLESRLPLVDFDPNSISAVDYDNDGNLDLYVSVELTTRDPAPGEKRPEFAYHDANDGGVNVLFRNNRQADSIKFDNVTRATGLDVRNRRHSLAAAWEDYDNDGDQDLYVGNDYGKNCLYRNDGGRFEEVAEEAGVVDQASGMSVSWGDYDRDGLMDLYVANMFSYAGSRVTRDDRFHPDAGESYRPVYQRFSKGNTLFRNLGNDRFEDVGAQASVEMGRWAWSSLFCDLNNDGWEDLLVANGYFSTEDTGDL